MLLIADIILTIIVYSMIILGIFGIVLGFAIFFMVIGGLNHGIAGWLWNIESRGAWTSLIGQGLVLGVLMLAFQVPALFIEIMFSFGPAATYLMYVIVQFIAFAFLYGILGKQVAMWFKQDPVTWPRPSTTSPWSTSTSPTPTSASSVGVPTYCPNCKAAFPISQSTHSEEIPKCRVCGVEIATHRQDAFAESAQTPGTSYCPYCGAEYWNNEIDVEGFVTCKECGAKIEARRSRPDRRAPPPQKRDPKDWDW